MTVINICFCFLFCVATLCGAFVFCLRAWHLHKVEKIDPVNVICTQRKITALSETQRQDRIQEILNLG